MKLSNQTQTYQKFYPVSNFSNKFKNTNNQETWMKQGGVWEIKDTFPDPFLHGTKLFSPEEEIRSLRELLALGPGHI